MNVYNFQIKCYEAHKNQKYFSSCNSYSIMFNDNGTQVINGDVYYKHEQNYGSAKCN